MIKSSNTMKRIVGILLLAAAILMSAAPASAKSPRQSDEQRLVRLDREIAGLSLRLNHGTWECYIDYACRMRQAIPVDKFKGADWQALLDTVPELKALQQQYREASARVTELLKTDPEYESIHREYISLKGVKDKAKNDANIQRYNLLYSRMRASNPDYPAANDAKRKAYRERNAALTRYLLDYYREQGREMPMTGVIGNYSSEMLLVRDECPELKAMNEKLVILRKLRKELQEQMLRSEFGVRKREDAKPDKSYVGSLDETM